MYINYYLYRLLGLVTPRIPPRLGYGICRLLAGVVYQYYATGRINVQRNLARILGEQTPEAELKSRARATFDYIMYNYFDLFRLPALDDEAVQGLVGLEGWQHVEAALADGTGIVMVSTHLGNIEVVLYAMLLRGLKITIPVERVEPPQLFDYISTLRTSKGLNLVPIDGPLLALLRTLKRGGVAGIAGDRDITETGQVVTFFGHPAHLPDGHVRLALKTKVPLVVGFSRRNDDHTHTAYFEPPFYLPTEGTEEERLAAGMDFVVKAMEKGIRQNPEQWTLTVSIWAD